MSHRCASSLPSRRREFELLSITPDQNGRLNLTHQDLTLADEETLTMDRLVSRLSVLDNVTCLDLDGNRIKDGGARLLADALARNSELATGQLTALSLTKNGVGARGAAALGEALRGNTSLRVLSLAAQQCPMRLEGIWVKRKPMRVPLSHSGPPGIRALTEGIGTNTHLTSLDLSGNGLRDDSAVCMASALDVGQLVVVNFANNDVTDVGAAHLARSIERNTTMTALDLSGNSIGDEGAAAIAAALALPRPFPSTLTSLNLSGNSRIGDAGASSLAEALVQNRGLRVLRLSLTDYWHLRRCVGMGPAGVRAIAEALKSHEATDGRRGTLTELDLGGQGIGPVGATALGEMLEANTTLRRLTLSMGDEDDREDYIERLPWSQRESVPECCIGAEGAARLGAALARNRSLRRLDLRHHGLGDEAATSLANALKCQVDAGRAEGSRGGSGQEGLGSTWQGLTGLDLDANEIGDDGMNAIGEAIAMQARHRLGGGLHFLSLAFNEHSEDGLESMLAALGDARQNPPLRVLRLDVPSEESATKLGESLGRNTVLTNLSVAADHVNVGDDAITTLMAAATVRAEQVRQQQHLSSWRVTCGAFLGCTNSSSITGNDGGGEAPVARLAGCEAVLRLVCVSFLSPRAIFPLNIDSAM